MHPYPLLMRMPSAQDDVMLELHGDDTHGEVPEDMLTELAFYVPPGNEDFPARGDEAPAAKVRDWAASAFVGRRDCKRCLVLCV